MEPIEPQVSAQAAPGHATANMIVANNAANAALDLTKKCYTDAFRAAAESA
jgi:hypothetical protein